MLNKVLRLFYNLFFLIITKKNGKISFKYSFTLFNIFFIVKIKMNFNVFRHLKVVKKENCMNLVFVLDAGECQCILYRVPVIH